MPGRAAASRTIAASPEAVWDVVGDPHHLPRWWPRVTRVEGVQADAFTEVLMGAKGKIVRADFTVLDVASTATNGLVAGGRGDAV